jgi:transposase InsO family protein
MLDYGLKAVREKKEKPRTAVRTAEQPGQAINVDLCYVPEKHTAQEKLPAVSGSSGRLVVERIRSQDEEPQWPGQVFAEAGLDYEEAMRQYAEATRDRLVHRRVERTLKLEEPTRWRKEWEGRTERYQVRQQRKQEDLDWKVAKAQWRKTRQAYQTLTRAERREQKVTYESAKKAWQHLRQQRQEAIENRKRENLAWHQRNQALKTELPTTAETRTWIAILVVTDNCTRQCLSLPVFRSGSKLTSAEVIAALQVILPTELQFLISDQGTHFRSNSFTQFAEDEDFIHVPVYRHRPETNGIAERFILTLKNWLRNKSWDTLVGLEEWLAEFLPSYNDRPHQGLAIPGLSPNEFAQRIWLM